jgi:CheY-like chemotaxis protein
MGGRIWVESAVGVGSTFHFTTRLGLQDVTVARPSPGSVDLDGLPVLVVDDDPTDLLLIEEFVSSFGMKVTGVDGAPAAIAAMSRARGAGKPYALVLVDVRMPGMDGFELAASLRREAERDGTSIMMLASAADRGDTGRCAAAGAAAFLLKPMKEREFLDAIQKCLGLARPDPSRPSARLRILLAEDTPVNQVLAVELLEERGHEVVLACDGREALDLLKRGSFDLILMDLQMPEMDGFEATAAIRAGEAGTGRRIPIIALTAHAMKGDRERCLAAGMDGYISKPIVPEQFIATVERRGPMPPGPGPGPGPRPEVGRESGPDVDLMVFDLNEALTRVCGKRSLLQKMSELFLADCPALLDQIRSALAAGDGPMLQRAAHRIKGSAANLSAARVVEVALRLEEIGRGGRLAGADSERVELADEVAKLRRALEILKGDATPCAS